MSDADLRAEAVRLLRRLAELTDDLGERGYAEGIADRIERDRGHVDYAYVVRVRGAVEKLEDRDRALSPIRAHHEATRLLDQAEALVRRALDVDGLDQGAYTDSMVDALTAINDGQNRLEESCSHLRHPDHQETTA